MSAAGDARRDALSASPYYREVLDRYPPFLKEEEMEFRRQMAAEGRVKEMKDELVLRNVGLISVHGRWWTRVFSPDDTVSIGITGLYEAAEAFDWTREDVRFSSFAGWYLKKVFHANKRAYASEVDENAVSFDAPVAGEDGEEGGATLGDFVSADVAPEDLVLKNDFDALCPGDVRRFAEALLVRGFYGKDDPVRSWSMSFDDETEDVYVGSQTSHTKKRVLEKYVAALRCLLKNPESSLAEIAEEVSRKTGLPVVSKERMRQVIYKIRNMITAGAQHLSFDKAGKLSAKPKKSDFLGTATVKTELEWDCDGQVYRPVDKVVYEGNGFRYDDWKRALDDWYARSGQTPDKVLESGIGVPFKNGLPENADCYTNGSCSRSAVIKSKWEMVFKPGRARAAAVAKKLKEAAEIREKEAERRKAGLIRHRPHRPKDGGEWVLTPARQAAYKRRMEAFAERRRRKAEALEKARADLAAGREVSEAMRTEIAKADRLVAAAKASEERRARRKAEYEKWLASLPEPERLKRARLEETLAKSDEAWTRIALNAAERKRKAAEKEARAEARILKTRLIKAKKSKAEKVNEKLVRKAAKTAKVANAGK